MSYLTFHAVFLLPPLAALAWAWPRTVRALGGRALWSAPLLSAIALAYTTPWDNYLVRYGVWSYGEARVLATVGYVPVEEYLFFLLQPLLTGLWVQWLMARRPARALVPPRRGRLRSPGVLLWAAAAAVGAGLLGAGPDARYLALILVWAPPVLALQWLYAGPMLRTMRGVLVPGVVAPTVYLWLADAVAIRAGVWAIAERYSTGVAPLGLPVEEAVFFLLTNLLVAQGAAMLLRGGAGAPDGGGSAAAAAGRTDAVDAAGADGGGRP